MNTFYVILGIAVFVLLLLLFFGYCAYRIAFKYRTSADEDPFNTLDRHPEFMAVRQEYIKSIIEKPYEAVRIKSRDGLVLFARYYHVKDGAPLEIQFHGYRGLSVRDLSASGKECHISGYNLLLVDQRAHGNSEGSVITFGIKERFDCLDWVDWAVSRFGREQKIILYGISMGAATVIMAAGEPLPDNVVGVIADCPYSSATDIIARVGKRLHIPAPITRIIAPIGARVFGGFNLNESSPVRAARRTDLPILLIHGEADNFVPCDMSREIYAANRNIELFTVPGAGHGFAFLVDTEGYRARVEAFLRRVTGENN